MNGHASPGPVHSPCMPEVMTHGTCPSTSVTCEGKEVLSWRKGTKVVIERMKCPKLKILNIASSHVLYLKLFKEFLSQGKIEVFFWKELLLYSWPPQAQVEMYFSFPDSNYTYLLKLAMTASARGPLYISVCYITPQKTTILVKEETGIKKEPFFWWFNLPVPLPL